MSGITPPPWADRSRQLVSSTPLAHVPSMCGNRSSTWAGCMDSMANSIVPRTCQVLAMTRRVLRRGRLFGSLACMRRHSCRRQRLAQGTISLSWAPSSGSGVSYTIYRGTTAGSETLYKSGITSPTFTDSAVVAGNTYFYKVTAVNAGAESPRSNEAFAMATAPSLVSIDDTVRGTGLNQFNYVGSWGTIVEYDHPELLPAVCHRHRHHERYRHDGVPRDPDQALRGLPEQPGYRWGFDRWRRGNVRRRVCGPGRGECAGLHQPRPDGRPTHPQGPEHGNA